MSEKSLWPWNHRPPTEYPERERKGKSRKGAKPFAVEFRSDRRNWRRVFGKWTVLSRYRSLRDAEAAAAAFIKQASEGDHYRIVGPEGIPEAARNANEEGADG